MTFLDPVYLVGMGISFVLGAFSYIIIMFWIRPISRYKKIKKHVLSDLDLYKDSDENKMDNTIKETVRKHSVKLSDSYTLEVPHWYRMVLDNRGELPVEASKHLMKMSNISSKEHFDDRMEKVIKALSQ